MSESISAYNVILIDKMTDIPSAREFLKSEKIGPSAVLPCSDSIWELNPRAFGANSMLGWFLKSFRANGGSFSGKSVAEIAEAVAHACVRNSAVASDDLPFDGDTRPENHTVSAVLVHEDTIQRAGFWPLVQAIRAEQRRQDFEELVIYTHTGDIRPQLFVEPPVRLSVR